MSEAQVQTEIEEDEGSATIAHEPIRVLEAMLFASSAPLTMNAMRERLPADADLGGMLMELQKSYEGKGVHLVEMNGSWAFRTATDLADALKISKQMQRKLSRAAMETLTIIAYHQPVTRAEIENIRGVDTSKGTLDVLMDCGWVKPGRRRETPGRPLTWGTTTTFMDHFGLETLSELPGLDELKASGLLDRRPAIDALNTGDLFAAEEEEIEEMAAAAEAEDEEAVVFEEDFDEDSDDSDDETTAEAEIETEETEDYYEDDIDAAVLEEEVA